MAFPNIPPVVGQLINGNAFDFSSISIALGPDIFTNLQSISYHEALEPGVLRGASAKKIARTRGQYEADGSFDIYKGDSPALLALLAALGAGGWGEASFDITVTYQEGVASLTTDKLLGCRITDLSDDHSQGSDALVSSYTIDIMDMTRNGLSMTSGGASAAGVVGAAAGGIVGNL